jgi:hypothetical protein
MEGFGDGGEHALTGNMDAAFTKVHHRSPNLRAKPKPCLNGGMLLCLDIASRNLLTECREETSQCPADLPIRLAKPSVVPEFPVYVYASYRAHTMRHFARTISTVLSDSRSCTGGQGMLPILHSRPTDASQSTFSCVRCTPKRVATVLHAANGWFKTRPRDASSHSTTSVFSFSVLCPECLGAPKSERPCSQVSRSAFSEAPASNESARTRAGGTEKAERR